ncbi:translation initiation factor 2 [Pseudomonas schmalbachii]|uniref:Translation initiation factor 2 n=1 Tax=Pseudomonas schmalbachii TaxID=2816993 RepID=A0ABS3TTU4_9PSED|nr:translation initiation factor 2 [Pseudomonas schmalbachii]MBO3277077.1 translation initiation factor 2 [Pseudomonas schmalbachii]
MLRRFVVLLCLPLLLSACGDEEKAAPPPASPAAAPQAVTPVVPPVPVARPEAAPAAQPSAKTEPLPAKAGASAEAPRKPVKKPEKVAASKQPAPLPPIDMHLPSDLVLASAAAAPVEAEKSLLPPMFVEKSSQGSFQLNGKLLHKEHAREDDYWQTVEGAELQFEFKH